MDYRYNNLNQLVEQSDDGWKTYTTSSYDNRGNLILETYHKGNKSSVTGAYTYDETNKMVLGINDIGESSAYLYNGLGALVENTWVIKKNAYGYHDVSADAIVDGEIVVDAATGNAKEKAKKDAESVAASPALNKTSTVVKQYVVDFSSETCKPLMEHEVGGLDYRYVYSDKARLSVVVQGIENGSASVLDSSGELHAYYHCDYLGTTDYLTSAVNSKVISWTSYNEWGEITHNAVLKCGQRELDLVKEYATHDFDAVLNQYYAKARFYDAENRRFVAVDPILNPSQYDLSQYTYIIDFYTQYLYVGNDPLNYIDITGLVRQILKINGVRIPDNGWKEVKYGDNACSVYVALNELGRASQASAWGSRDNRGYLRYTTGMNSEEFEFMFGDESASVFYEDWLTEKTALQIAFHKDSGKFFINLHQFNKYHSVDISYAMRFVGFGLQVEVSAPLIASFGTELVWYTYSTNKIDAGEYHCYLYGGGTLTNDNVATISTLIRQIATDPTYIQNSGKAFKDIPAGWTVSASIFAIYANKLFEDAKDYRGTAKSLSGTVNHVKGYVSFGNTCTTVGIGLDPFSKFGCNTSRSIYCMVGDGELFLTGITVDDLKDFVHGIAVRLPAPRG